MMEPMGSQNVGHDLVTKQQQQQPLVLVLKITSADNIDLSHYNSPMMGTSLVTQWLRICLLMQWTQVQSLVGAVRSTRHRATKPPEHT